MEPNHSTIPSREKNAQARIMRERNKAAALEIERAKLELRRLEASGPSDCGGPSPVSPNRQTKESLLEFLGGVVVAAQRGETELRDGITAAKQIAGMEGWETKAADPTGAEDIVNQIEATLARYSAAPNPAPTNKTPANRV